jgi:hypothetical protein
LSVGTRIVGMNGDQLVPLLEKGQVLLDAHLLGLAAQ